MRRWLHVNLGWFRCRWTRHEVDDQGVARWWCGCCGRMVGREWSLSRQAQVPDHRGEYAGP